MNSKNILVLGAGMISPPLVRYLLGRTPHRLLVAALDTQHVEQVLEEYTRGRVIRADLSDDAVLGKLMDEADLVVSLLPASHNPRVARLALDRRLPFVNTSYLAAATRELDEEARREGVLLLNEIGLDPGIDHMSGIRLIRKIRARGGRVERFLSVCGGVPATAANTNPWGYKFSWFPRAVLLAGRQPARYLREGSVVEVAGPDLFAHCWPFPVPGQGVLEIYPNRDSLAYQTPYGLNEARGLFRGTIRYPGWSATLKAVADMGLLDIEETTWPEGTTYQDLSLRLVPPGAGSGVERLSRHLDLDPGGDLLARLEWAGLLSDRPLPFKEGSPLDAFVHRLMRLMQYRPGEQDLVHLEHRAVAVFPDGHSEEIQSRLVLEGEPFGDSAMARTVSSPAAIAVRLILEGRLDATGVQIPTAPEFYRAILPELESMGMGMEEHLIHRHQGPLDSAPHS